MAKATLNERQHRTERARQAFDSRFSSPEEKSEYFRDIGRKSAESRLVFTGEEADAIRAAYRLLRRVAERKLEPQGSQPSEEPAVA